MAPCRLAMTVPSRIVLARPNEGIFLEEATGRRFASSPPEGGSDPAVDLPSGPIAVLVAGSGDVGVVQSVLPRTPTGIRLADGRTIAVSEIVSRADAYRMGIEL